MVEHVVLIKWREDTPQPEKDRILQELSDLKDKILGIVSYHVGHNFSDRSQGYHAAVTSVFVDRTSLDAYVPHPEHQRIAAQLKVKAENVLVVDFQPTFY